MIASYAIGLAATALVVGLWLLVQLGWREVFADGRPDVDALAGRGGCHGCSHEPTNCKKQGGCPEEIP